MSVTKIIEVVGRSTEGSDAAVKNALAEAGRTVAVEPLFDRSVSPRNLGLVAPGG